MILCWLQVKNHAVCDKLHRKQTTPDLYFIAQEGIKSNHVKSVQNKRGKPKYVFTAAHFLYRKNYFSE